MAAPAQRSELQLPALRQDLQLHPGAPTLTGALTWLIHDPVRHRYFQVSNAAIELIRNWRPIGLDQFINDVTRESGREPDEEEVREVARFLFSNNLTETPPDNDPAAYAAQIKGRHQSPLLRLIHGYLFFRIPIVRPDRFLRATLPLLSALFTKAAVGIILAATLIGLYLVSRQWEAFTATFISFLTLEGALAYGVALAFIKSLHELGHAYAATRYGVRVNTMGIAFMVLFPLLYTDVSDAWRLTSRRKKLAIDAAGLTVELALAGRATFRWVVWPGGAVRSALCVVASSGWRLSLAVNVNPFMRFDGYYLLSDAWGIPNLQTRGFAMARWQLREWLFGLNAAPPEQFPLATRNWLITYAFATWIWRLFLFIGIALLVYHMFFKVLGVALFVVEILWFILLPVWREMKQWWELREDIMAAQRTLITLSILAALILVIAIPWSGRIIIPAITTGNNEVRLFPARAARLAELRVTNRATVKKGAVLAVLHSDELDHKQRQARRRIALLRARLARVAGDAEERADRVVLETELKATLQELSGLDAETKRLTVTAPFAGRIRDLASDLHPGRYLKPSDAIGRLISNAAKSARGNVHEEQHSRLAVGRQGRFIPDDPSRQSSPVTISDIARLGSATVDIKYLASPFGGRIAADRVPDGAIKPRSGQHVVRFTLQHGDNDIDDDKALRGVVHIEGEPESILAAIWRRVLKVLVREAGI